MKKYDCAMEKDECEIRVAGLVRTFIYSFNPQKRLP